MSRSTTSRTEQVLREFHEEGALGKAYDTRLVKRLWPFVRPYRRSLGLSLGVILLTAVGSLVRPLIMLHAIDQGVLAGRPDVLLRGGLWIAALVIVEQVLGFVQIYAMQVVGARAMADLRREVFRFLHSLRLGFFDRQPVGRLVTRVTNDVDAILDLFASGALNAVGDLVRLVGIVALMLALDYKLALIAFAVTPPVALLVVLVRRRMREVYREIRAKTARLNATMNEHVSGMVVIQAYNREQAAAREFDAINAANRDAHVHSIKFEAMQDAAIEMVAAVCLASIVVALGYHPVSFGTLVAFNAYLVQFFEPISALAQRYTLLQSAMAGAERVFGLLDGAQHELDAPALPAAASKNSDHAFELEHVSFSYKPDVPVLSDLSLAVRRGEKIALVGPTGSGKSTLASLLLRLYDVQAGIIRVGGKDVNSLDRTELRRRFAVVPQDVFLFPGSVIENIGAGDVPDRERAVAVLRRLGALDLFQRRAGGLDALVQEHGANFSAGERQLIAFARALYRDAPILVLDEATASIDSDTESRLQHALEELMRDRTALVIAHRLSTIRHADRIVVFHKGKIAEQGTHAELLARGGLYARLHELQFARQQPPPPAISAAI
jgi:ATP-binding cassette, subfamily B, multidrug efflux pump